MFRFAVIAGLYLFLRAWGAAVRAERFILLKVIGWLVCSLSVWILTCALGTWSAIWIILIPAALGLVLGQRWLKPQRTFLTDVAATIIIWMLSRPPLSMAEGALLVLGAAIGGAGIDSLVSTLKRGWRLRVIGGTALLTIAALPFVLERYTAIPLYLKSTPARLWNLGVTPSPQGRLIRLPNGTAAWLDGPNRKSRKAALLFHGNNPAASSQPSAMAIRLALRQAGYTVLSMDHPGYGRSPGPGVADDIERWNPLPSCLEALKKLKELAGTDDVILVGHSMGCNEVLRVLKDHSREVRAGVLMGAADGTSPASNDRWYKRFHRDRRIKGWLGRPRYQLIHEKFYDIQRLISDLPRDHAPILHVRFAHENLDLLSSRDNVFARFPGPKKTADLDSTHYLNTVSLDPFILGDVTVPPRLAGLLEQEFSR